MRTTPASGPVAASFTVVVTAGLDPARALESVRRQTVAPARIVFEDTDPARALESAGAQFVAILCGSCEALPTWLAALAAALSAGADLAYPGALWMGEHGLIAEPLLPDPTRPSSRDLARAGSFAVRRDRARRTPAVAALPRPLVRVHRRPAGFGAVLPSRVTPADVPIVDIATPLRDRVAPTVSVVLPVRDGATTIGAQLAGLAAQTYSHAWELIVADNGSTDRTLAIVAEFRPALPAVRVVQATLAAGEGYTRNVGVAAATGELLAFCDADDVVAPGWLAALAAAARDADVVGGALEVSELSPAFADEQPLPMPEQGEFLPFARSANCGVWRDVLAEIGGWRSDLRGGGEDMDLSWRAGLCGFRVCYAPDALVHYRLRGRLRALVAQKWRYGRSGARLYRTYRHAGLQRRSLRVVAGNWLWLAVHLADLVRSAHRRRRWLRYAARLAGFAWGSVEQRVRYL